MAVSALLRIVVPQTWHRVIVDTNGALVQRAWLQSCGQSSALETETSQVDGEFPFDCPTAFVLINSGAAQYWCSIGYIADGQPPTEFRFKIADGKCGSAGERRRVPRESKKPYRLNL